MPVGPMVTSDWRAAGRGRSSTLTVLVTVRSRNGATVLDAAAAARQLRHRAGRSARTRSASWRAVGAEDRRQLEADPQLLADARHEANGDQRVAADVEEVVVIAMSVTPKRSAEMVPNGRHDGCRCIRRCPGGPPSAIATASRASGARKAVEVVEVDAEVMSRGRPWRGQTLRASLLPHRRGCRRAGERDEWRDRWAGPAHPTRARRRPDGRLGDLVGSAPVRCTARTTPSRRRPPDRP